ncbi:MAG: DUF4388 domain-containing protein [Myxococcota bacterium]
MRPIETSEVRQDTDDLEELSEPTDRLWVELQPDGRMRVASQEARDLLRGRLARAELLPTGRGWALFVDNAAQSVPLPDHLQREVVCGGTLAGNGISLIDFVGFLATSYESGVVTVSSRGIERSIFLHQGDVVWASSTSEEDRLGEFLLRRGKITREQLQTALREGCGRRIGRACVECGFLAPHELWSAVQAQLTEIFDQMLRTDEGLWTFSRTKSEALAESRIHISTQGLLVDALRRLDELRLYRKSISSASALIQRTADGPIPIIKDVDPADVDLLLRQLPRAATIQELMRYTGRSEYDVTRLVYHMVKAQLVEVIEPPRSSPQPPVVADRFKDVIDVYAMAFREMVHEVRAVHRDDALLHSAEGFINDPGQRFAQVLELVQIDADGRLDADRILAGTLHHGFSAEVLREALGELLFFLLFQATDLLGHKRGDDLARRVKIILSLLSREPSS